MTGHEISGVFIGRIWMSNINISLWNVWECKPWEKRNWRRGENKSTSVCTQHGWLMGRDWCLLKCRAKFNFKCKILRVWTILCENILKMKHFMPISASHRPEIRVYEENQWKVVSRGISTLPCELLFLPFVLTAMEQWKGVLIQNASCHDIMQSCAAHKLSIPRNWASLGTSAQCKNRNYSKRCLLTLHSKHFWAYLGN